MRSSGRKKKPSLAFQEKSSVLSYPNVSSIICIIHIWQPLLLPQALAGSRPLHAASLLQVATTLDLDENSCWYCFFYQEAALRSFYATARPQNLRGRPNLATNVLFSLALCEMCTLVLKAATFQIRAGPHLGLLLQPPTQPTPEMSSSDTPELLLYRPNWPGPIFFFLLNNRLRI